MNVAKVSILVLMDVAFEFVNLPFVLYQVIGFNPCSYGCCF